MGAEKTEETPPDQRAALYEQWKEDHLEREPLRSKHFREALSEKLLPWVQATNQELPEDESQRATKQTEVMTVTGRFFNRWLLQANKASATPREAFEGMSRPCGGHSLVRG